MSFPLSLSFVREHLGSLFLIGLFAGAASFFVLTLTENRFETSVDFLVVQGNAASQDFYTISRSSEYLGKVLSEAIYSERFITAVIETGKVNPEFLPFDKRDRLVTWRHMVTVGKNIELGLLRVSVKSDSEREAVRVMEAVSAVLIEKNALFRGGDEKGVDVRVLSGPITERNPSPKEIIAVVVGGFAFSILLALLFLFLKQQVFLERRAYLNSA